MRRAIVLAALAVAALVVLTVSLGSGDGRPSGYEVKAIFDNAPVNVGADVLVSGVPIGKVAKLDLTKENKAALTLRIDDKRFTPFHADATCGNRPQSLIGERAVVCEPGTVAQPVLKETDGGQHLLPLERTSGSIDLDIVDAIYRRPAPQQLAVLLAELGAGTAARGPELAAIIRRATPGLQETDRVLRTLAQQTDALRALARDGGRSLKPLAAERRRLVGFIRGSDRAATAGANQPEALGRGLDRLAPSLRSLQSVMAQLKTFADQATPILAKTADSAATLSAATQATPGFARRAAPAVQQLGTTARNQQRDIPKLDPLSARLVKLGTDLEQPAKDLATLLTSLERGNGIKNLLGTIYGAASANNGFDASGHYLRTQVLSGACGQYANAQFFGCDAQFGDAKINTDIRARTRQAAATPKPSPVAAKAFGASGAAGTRKATDPADATGGFLDYLLGAG